MGPGPSRLEGFDVRPHSIGLSTVRIYSRKTCKGQHGKTQHTAQGTQRKVRGPGHLTPASRDDARTKGARALHGLQLWMALPLAAEAATRGVNIMAFLPCRASTAMAYVGA